MHKSRLQEKDDFLSQNLLVSMEHLYYITNNSSFQMTDPVFYPSEYNDAKGIVVVDILYLLRR
jgi:hypothetical protein